MLNMQRSEISRCLVAGWLALSTLLLPVACAPAGQESVVIKIGVAAPLTGDLAKIGQDIANSARMAVEEFNKTGGVNGKLVELLTMDDKADPKEGLLVANKLVSSNVVGVIGHLNSGVSIPASTEVYSPNGILMISPASTNPDLTEKGKPGLVFRTIGRDDQQGRVAADFATKRKFKNVIILHDKTQYGQGLADEFKGNISKAGLKVLLYEGIVRGDKDFRSILTKVKGQNPDLLFFGGVYPEAGLLAKQAREVGLRAPLLTGDGVYDQQFVKIAGVQAAAGTFITFPRAPQGPFMAEYKKQFGEPGPYSGYTYDATRILLQAVKKVGEADKTRIAQMVGQTRNFDGVTGKITFTAKGDLDKTSFIVWQVDPKGQFVPAR